MALLFLSSISVTWLQFSSCLTSYKKPQKGYNHRNANLKHHISHLLLSKEGDTVVEDGTSQSPKGRLQARLSRGPVEILQHRPFACIITQWVNKYVFITRYKKSKKIWLFSTIHSLVFAVFLVSSQLHMPLNFVNSLNRRKQVHRLIRRPNQWTKPICGQDVKTVGITIYQAIDREMQSINKEPQKPGNRQKGKANANSVRQGTPYSQFQIVKGSTFL